jgi:hypothetical protein
MTEPLDRYLDAVRKLAVEQSRSSNPITQAWARAHAAMADWLASLEPSDVVVVGPAPNPRPEPVAEPTGGNGGNPPIEAEDPHAPDAIVQHDPPTVPYPPPPPYNGGSNGPGEQARSLVLEVEQIDITDEFVIVEVRIHVHGYQKVDVDMGDGTFYELDANLVPSQPITGRHSYKRPDEIAVDRLITATGYVEAFDSMTESKFFTVVPINGELPV